MADRYVATTTPGGKPVTHGTRSTYVNYRCRCEDCTAAAAREVAEWRARRSATS